MPFFGRGFDPIRDIPSLKDRVILVTGGNSGLGKQSVLEYARHEPAKIFLASRDTQKATAAVQDIKKQCPDVCIEPLELDLSSLESVKAAAKTFRSKSDRLDILMLNAGIMYVPHGTTKDGYEVHFGTNHMGHALLTKLLIPTLLQTAEKHKADVRVVVLSSAAIGWTPSEGVDFTSLKAPSENMTPFALYGQSKLSNALFAQELARQYPALTVSGIHPGVVNTNLGGALMTRYPLLNVARPFMPIFMTSSYSGSKNQLWASVSKDVVSGEFYVPVGVIGKIMGVDKVHDKELAKRLWDWTEAELKGQEI